MVQDDLLDPVGRVLADPFGCLLGRTHDAGRSQFFQFVLELVGTILTLVLATVLLLSAAGVYALMSLTVAQRRREIGIRTALGASQHRVLLTVFSRIARQMGIGVVVGAIIATILDRITGPVAAAQTVLLVPAVALLMLVVGFCAAFVPTRRGLSVQPVEALRGE